MQFLDWTIVTLLIVAVVIAAFYTKRYTNSVSDFLAANRVARRYMLCIAGGMGSVSAIMIVGKMEMYYSAGFPASWWWLMMMPVGLIMVLSGWVQYRYRETRVFTLAQFFEARYSKKFRVYAGIIGWAAGIINFGIFPAVGARFFMYYCGLPEYMPLLGMQTYHFIMIFLLGISLFFVFIGGQIAVMFTDFIQGMFTNVVLVLILIFILWKFDWGSMMETLQNAPSGASMLNPYKTTAIKDFNFFFFLIGIFGFVYSRMAWQGEQGYACSAKTAHESRMGGILGEWRGLVLALLLMMLPIATYYVMHSPLFADTAAETHQYLATIDSSAVRSQMLVPIALSKFLPTGIVGAFCAIMLAAFITTHDTYLHSWGSIFVQDVILPFRKKPFTQKQHLWLLRGSIGFVAVFIFLFSALFPQNEYILMFFSITGAIFIGGAGACIIGGLYWKRGSTSGAWVALTMGAACAILSIVLRQCWAPHIYPWLENDAPKFLNVLTYVCDGISNHIPGVNWRVTPEECPFNSSWLSLFTMLFAIFSYVACSLFDWLVLHKEPHNMDKLLHRGKYTIEEGQISKPPTGIKAIMPSEEFSKSDKVIYYSQMFWSLGLFVVFVIATIWNLSREVSDGAWATFWWWKIMVTLVIGIITTFWLFIGGLFDAIDMFKTLKEANRNTLDNGMINQDGVNMGEE